MSFGERARRFFERTADGSPTVYGETEDGGTVGVLLGAVELYPMPADPKEVAGRMVQQAMRNGAVMFAVALQVDVDVDGEPAEGVVVTLEEDDGVEQWLAVRGDGGLGSWKRWP